MYLYAIDYDNYGIVIADGDVDGNDVTESDDSYDYYINTSDDDDDDDDADYDEILTVECDNSVKINSNDRWLNNSVLNIIDMFCNVYGLTLLTMQLLCTYMLLIMIIMALLLLMVMLMVMMLQKVMIVMIITSIPVMMMMMMMMTMLIMMKY